METKITQRKSGWTALLTCPWGEKIRFLGLATKEEAQAAVAREIECKLKYRELKPSSK